jgi:hypothetical protein
VNYTPDPDKSRENLGKKLGNNPGPHRGPSGKMGPPTKAVRDACKQAFLDRVPILCEIADSSKLKPNERTRALELLARYGIGEKISVEFTNEEVFAQIARVTAEFMSAEHFDGWYRRCVDALQEA